MRRPPSLDDAQLASIRGGEDLPATVHKLQDNLKTIAAQPKSDSPPYVLFPGIPADWVRNPFEKKQ